MKTTCSIARSRLRTTRRLSAVRSQDNADHAQRRAPQRIRVLRSGRLLVDRPEARQNVDLVGQRDGDRHRIGRHEIVRALRLVVILDGVRRPLRPRPAPGVVAAHQALQLGEFADHLGQRDRPCRAAPRARPWPRRRRPAARDAPASATMRAMRSAWVPSFSWNTMCSNFGRRSSSLRLQIGLVEELRVRQPRADDALVAGDDRRAAVARLDVGDEDELVGELRGLRIAHHEAFLVVADGGADDLLGDREERLVERAHQHHRPFDQPRDLGQQALVLDQLVALREGEGLRVGQDHLARGAPDRARPWPRRAWPCSRRAASP